MTATTSPTNTAAPSTSAAAPAASHAVGNQRSAAPAAAAGDADAEFEITAADVAAALGQLSDAPQAGNSAADNSTDETNAEGEESAGAVADVGETAEADPAGESEAETPAEGDAGAEASGDVEQPKPEAETPAEKPEEKPDAIQKRINELTAARRSAEDEAARLREQVAALRQGSSTEATAAQIQAIDTPQDLQQEHHRMVRLHEWSLKHEATGGRLPDGRGGEHEFTPEQVLDLKANTFRMLQVDLPQRAQYLQVKQQADSLAVQSYPWLANTREGDGARVQQLLEAKPQLRELTPAYRLAAADLLVGEKLRTAGIAIDDKLIERLRAERSATGKPKEAAARSNSPALAAPRRLPPQAPGRPGVLPARVQPRAAQNAAANKRLSKGDGNVNDLTASIAGKFG